MIKNEELKEACKPLLEYLDKNQVDPYTYVVVTTDSIRLLCAHCGIPVIKNGD